MWIKVVDVILTQYNNNYSSTSSLLLKSSPFPAPSLGDLERGWREGEEGGGREGGVKEKGEKEAGKRGSGGKCKQEG